MLTRALPLVAVGLACGFLVGCGNDGSTDAGRDAGADAGRDAASRPDASRDAGPPDAGRDAGAAATGWVRIEGLPDICDIEVAREPSAAVEPFGFEPCPDLERCRQLVADFPEHPRGIRFQVQPQSYYVDSERILFGYYRPMLIGGRDLNYMAIATATGDHVAVVRSPPLRSGREYCTINRLSPAADSYAFTVSYRTPAGATFAYVLRAPYTAPADVQRLWVGEGPTTSSFVQSIEVSDSIVGMFTPIPIQILRVDSDGETITLCPATPGTPYCGLDEVVGGSVLASHDHGGWWVAIADADDSSFRPLIDSPDAEDATARSDGIDLVWMRGYDPEAGRPTRFELWASPYAETPETLVPRRIAPINATGFNLSIGVGNGHAFTGERGDVLGEPSYLAIHDLATGERRTYRFREDEGFGSDGPILGRDEVAIPIHRLPPAEYRETETVRFIEYDALPLEPAPE